MDKDKVNEIKSWLSKGWEDIQSAEWLMKSPQTLYSSVAFHCQQAAEKVLKAYLTWLDVPFEKTHSLLALVGKCLAYNIEFEKLRIAAITLTPYAIASRYPGDLPELSRDEAEEAIKLVFRQI